MLYDFHTKQNAKKPGTIHATYLLSGTKRPVEPMPLSGDAKKDGEDDYMQSSPFMSSVPQPEEGTGESSVLSITLCREEDLEGRHHCQIPKAMLTPLQMYVLNTSTSLQYISTVLSHIH
jgi:DNA polymerase subunit Cdc27